MALDEKDATLSAALKEIELATTTGDNTKETFSASQVSHVTPGTRLATFLKDQLRERDNSLLQAREEISVLHAVLSNREAEVTSLTQQLTTARQQMAVAVQHTNKNSQREMGTPLGRLLQYNDIDDGNTAVNNNTNDDVFSEVRPAVSDSGQGSVSFRIRSADHKAGITQGHLRSRSNNNNQEEENMNEDEDEDESGSQGTVSEAEAAVMSVRKSMSKERHRMMIESKNNYYQDNHHHNHQYPQQQHSGDVEVGDERPLKSELDLVERKYEKSAQMLLAANHAVRVLRHKLQKERRSVADLQAERCRLQAQLLSTNPQLAMEHAQVSQLMQELAGSRHRMEQLLQDKAVLQAQLDLVQMKQSQQAAAEGAQQGSAAAAAAAEGAQTALIRHLETELVGEKAKVQVLESEKAALEAKMSMTEGEKAGLETRLADVQASLSAAQQEVAVMTSSSSAAQPAFTTLTDLLTAERQRCDQLSQQLEFEKSQNRQHMDALLEAEAAADEAAEDSMRAREALMEERAQLGHLHRELTSQQSKAEALSVNLSRLELADGTLVRRLAEENAHLQGQLAALHSQASGAGIQVESLQQAVTLSEGHRQAIQDAATEAAQQLLSLSVSHTQLEAALEKAAAERDTAVSDLETSSGRVADLEAAVVELSDKIDQALGQRDVLVDELENCYAQLQALHKDAQAARQAQMSAEEQVAQISEDRDMVEKRLEAVEQSRDRLSASLEALKAEAHEARHAGAKVAEDNQQLLNSVCDMSGLVDALQTVQQQVRLLEAELEHKEARRTELVVELEREKEGRRGAEKKGQDLKETVKQHSTKIAQLEREQAQLVAELEMGRRGTEALAEQHEALQAAWDRSQERQAELKASLSSAKEEAERAQYAAQQAKQCAEEACHTAATASREAETLTADNALLKQRAEKAEAHAAAAAKSANVAHGQLLLAQRQEALAKHAGEQLAVLQQDLTTTLARAEEQGGKRREAEERCLELESRCLSLEGRCQSLGRDLARAQDAASARQEQVVKLSGELEEAQRAHHEVQAQLAGLATIHDRLADLEMDHAESNEWITGLMTELQEKTEQVSRLTSALAQLQQEAESAKSQVGSLENAVASAQDEASQVLAAKDAAVFSLEAASGVLHEMSSQVEQLNEECKQLTVEVEELTANKRELLSSVEQRVEEVAREVGLRQSVEGQLETVNREAAVLREVKGKLEEEVKGMNVALKEMKTSLEDMTQQTQQALQQALQQCQELSESTDTAVTAQHAALEMCAELKEQWEADKERAAQLAHQLQLAESDAEEAREVAQRAQRHGQQLEEEATAARRDVGLLEDQCRVLRDQLDTLFGTANTATSSRDGATFHQQEAAAKVDVLREELYETRAEREGAKEKARSLQDALHRAELDVEQAQHRMEVAERAARLAEEQCIVAQQAAGAVNARLEEVASEKHSLEQQLAVSNLLREHTDEEIMHLRSSLAEKTLTLEALQARIASSEHDALSRLAEVLDQLHGIQQSTEEDIEQAGYKLAVVKREIQELEDEATEVRRHKLCLRLTQVEEALVQLAGLRQECNEAVALYNEHAMALVQETDEEGNREEEKRCVSSSPLQPTSTIISPPPQSTSSSISSNNSGGSWKIERRVLKAVCKLALAVAITKNATTTSTTRSATTVQAEVEPLIMQHADVVASMGLDVAWAALVSIVASSSEIDDGGDGNGNDTNIPMMTMPGEYSNNAGTATEVHIASFETELEEAKKQVAALKQQLTDGQAERCQAVQSAITTLKGVLSDICLDAGSDDNDDEGESGLLSRLEGVADRLGTEVRKLASRHRSLSLQFKQVVADSDGSKALVLMDSWRDNNKNSNSR
jgi:chromosome segregation ATPase